MGDDTAEYKCDWCGYLGHGPPLELFDDELTGATQLWTACEECGAHPGLVGEVVLAVKEEG